MTEGDTSGYVGAVEDGGNGGTTTSDEKGVHLGLSATSVPVETSDGSGRIPDIMEITPEQALVYLNKFLMSLLALHGCVMDDFAIEDEEASPEVVSGVQEVAPPNWSHEPVQVRLARRRRWSSDDVGETSTEDMAHLGDDSTARRSSDRAKKASFFLAEAHEVALLVVSIYILFCFFVFASSVNTRTVEKETL
jgi:hypothetical protein